MHGKDMELTENKQMDFNLMAERGDFIKNMDQRIPNDERFNMNEMYDRSTYLTKVRRIQGRDFNSYSKRNTGNLMMQAGDLTYTDIIKKGTRSEEFYEQEQKE